LDFGVKFWKVIRYSLSFIYEIWILVLNFGKLFAILQRIQIVLAIGMYSIA